MDENFSYLFSKIIIDLHFLVKNMRSGHYRLKNWSEIYPQRGNLHSLVYKIAQRFNT